MITLVMVAKDIPEDTVVRKVTGRADFTLKRTITINGINHAGKDKAFFAETDTVILMNDHSISVIAGSRKLAIDFQTPQELLEFVERELIAHP